MSPLGAAALAGTSYPIDREFTAKELGFAAPTQNSLDSVSDRDFVVEFLNIVILPSLSLAVNTIPFVGWALKPSEPMMLFSIPWSFSQSIPASEMESNTGFAGSVTSYTMAAWDS